MVTRRRALTIVFGALPATWLTTLGFAFTIFWATDLPDGILRVIVGTLWGLAGLVGSTALWGVGLGFVRPNFMPGLIVAAIALLPMAAGADPLHLDSDNYLNPMNLSALVSMLVAMIWLGFFARCRLAASKR